MISNKNIEKAARHHMTRNNISTPQPFSLRRPLSSLMLSSLLFSLNLQAASPLPEPERASLQKLVQQKGCASCHGTRGQGNPAMKGPQLSGQSSKQLEEKLKAYRDDSQGRNPTMVMMAYSLKDNEIQQLARWFSQFP